jgi:hypothetical protein
LKGKWHFGATFINNEGNNVIGCIYLMNITGARGTFTLKNQKKSIDKRHPMAYVTKITFAHV